MSDASHLRFAEVALDTPLRRTFDYRLPDALLGRVAPGMRVRVPFGKNDAPRDAYCVGLREEPRFEGDVKDVLEVLDDRPVLSEKVLQLTRWMADYYMCSWGAAIATALPGGAEGETQMRTVNVVRLVVAADEIEALLRGPLARARKQAAVVEFLDTHRAEEFTVQELAERLETTPATIAALRNRGVVEYEPRVSEAAYADDEPVERRPPPRLTADQQAVCERIFAGLDKRLYGVTLLHGVTGSGKTEVYLRAIERVLARGQSAIVLVPEISLTPQTIRRFRERFENVAVLHSRLTRGQSAEYWRRLREGECRVVVGAQSAVFAPVRSLGLIVVDEEHEPSFKHMKTPRYNARDMAVVRARLENAYVILGSATPSLESYYNTRQGKYELVTLPHRIGHRPMPPVTVVNMREENWTRKGRHALSRLLERLMGEALDQGRQVMLFLNRRGHSTYIHCFRCGFVLTCERCDIALTYHQGRNACVCHYCNAVQPAPRSCPDCGMPNINYFGLGTQKVEEEVRRKFPDAACARMDSDTTTGRGAHERILREFREGRVQILLGTQMIAKGLDFPNVTVVGVILPDIGLSLPDFRAAERTFQLVAQVAGRTGRGPHGGRVVVQTFLPDHYSIRYAARHDYPAFAAKELAARKPLRYPPYTRMVRIVFAHKNQEQARAAAQTAADELRSHAEEEAVRVDGPAPAPIALIRGKFRWQVFLRGESAEALRRLVKRVEHVLQAAKAVQITIDVDPLNMM